MSGKVITIVGGGASAVALVYSLLEGISQRAEKKRLTIYMLEKRSEIGRGLAYSEDGNTNLLNTKAGFITPFTSKPAHFYNWLINNRESWEDNFPEVEINPDAFLPRPLFGHYLMHMVQMLIQKAVSLGCCFIPIKDEAINMSSSYDGKVVISTKNNLSFPSDHVVLSCGNGGSTAYSELKEKTGFFASPYPIKRTTRLIPSEAQVAIIGSRLSAIDTVLGLKARGHKGKITLHSRSGAFPSVRGAQGRLEPKFLTLENVQQHIKTNGQIQLNEFIGWLFKELEAAGQAVSFDLAAIDENCSQLPPLEFLTKELENAEKERPWQAVLYATNNIIDLVWSAMPEQDKQRFWPYLSWWLVYRVSIPIENAVKLKALLESGELEVIPGAVETQSNGAQFVLTSNHQGVSKQYNYDSVVVATGTPRNIHQLDNQLIQNLLTTKTALPNQYGGIEICSTTGCLKNGNGQIDERVTVLGELTSGTYFFTSVLEINARHAADRAELILGKLMANKNNIVVTEAPRLQA